MNEEIKVSELDSAEEIRDSDQIMIVQGGINKKVIGEKINDRTISDSYGISEQKGYSQKYQNEHNVVVSSIQPTTSERVWFRKGKNLLNCNGFTTYTGTNVTVTPSFTDNKLNYINATKSASTTDTVFVTLAQFIFNLETGTYILNGCPSGGGDSTYSLYFRDNTTNTDVSPRDIGSGASVSLTNGHNYTLYLRIANTSTFTDKKFYPMLRKATITDDTYEPYVQKAININGEDEYYTNEYSTTEQVVGKWIDGKPIYRKIITYGTMPTGAVDSPTVNHNIANIDLITHWYGFCVKNDGLQYNFDHVAAINMGSNMTIATRVNKQWVQVAVNADMSAFTGYFVIEYTKTTD